MAENEDKAPEGGEEAQVDKYAEKAKALGWRPQEEYEGDPEEWVDAKEFVKRKPLYDKNHKLDKKVKDLEKTVHDLTNHLGKVSEVAYKKAIADLEARRDEAIDLGDRQQVKEIDKAIKEVEAVKPENAPAVDPALKEWEAENGKWFYADEEITTFGIAHCQTYFTRNPGKTWEDALPGMEKAIKKAFPEKFENPKRKDPPPVETGGSHGGKKTFTRSDLNEEQRKVLSRFVRQGVMSEEEYIKGLVEIGELGGKK